MVNKNNRERRIGIIPWLVDTHAFREFLSEKNGRTKEK